MDDQPTVDVEVLWDLLHETGGRYEPSELAELAVGDDRAASVAVVSEALRADRVHFRERKGLFQPRPRASVEESRKQARLKAEREGRLALAVEATRAALEAGETLDRSAHESVLEPIEGLAVHGEAYPRRQAAEELLEALNPGAPGPPAFAAFELLRRVGWFAEHEHLGLIRAGIPRAFRAAALEEARVLLDGAGRGSGAPREDRRDLLSLAVDDDDTIEVDDALSVTEGPHGGAVVEVHIADAAEWVPRGGAIEADAARRAATLYHPDERIPMLPPDLVAERMSLDAGVDREAMTFRISLDEAGEIVDFEPVLTRVRIDRQLTYEEADEEIGRDTPEGRALALLHSLAERSRRRRHAAGALVVQSPEQKVHVEEDGRISIRPLDRGSPSRLTVQEWMIVAGGLAAGWLDAAGIPAVYRSQPPPRERATPLPDGHTIDAATFLGIVKGFRKASVGTEPGPHSGLGLESYVQVTSPIRRYADLMLQHQIRGGLIAGRGPLTETDLATVAAACAQADDTLRRLERESIRYWTVQHLASRRGEVFEALVLEARDHGRCVVELTEVGLRQGVSLGSHLQPGDTVHLEVVSADARRDRVNLREVRVQEAAGQIGETSESEG